MLKRCLLAVLAMALLLPMLVGAAWAEPSSDALPEPGDTICGFTLRSIEVYAPLQAQILSFHHEVSGADLCYIKNSDANRVFCIGYRTPLADNSDSNHVLEHVSISSSDKYPSRDVFFDCFSGSYTTFLNAMTYSGFTCFPTASLSEEQLLKLADVTLDCLVHPSFMKDENYFKREGLRYVLYDMDDPIGMSGVVFAEDTGYMCDVAAAAYGNTWNALYPGEVSANRIGEAWANYRDLTYENVKASHDRAYHFDNSLLLLYGDLNLERFLEFLDREYLSKAQAGQTDLSAYLNAQQESGHVEQLCYVPAYEGDRVKDSSYIYYAMDLYGKESERLMYFDVLAGMLSAQDSTLCQRLEDAGLYGACTVNLSLEILKPALAFSLANANPEDAALFKSIVDETLLEIAENGFDEGFLKSSLVKLELEDGLIPESEDGIATIVFPTIVAKWSLTGETDYFSSRVAALEKLMQDEQQELIRALARELVEVPRSALVTSVPQPGLAEANEAEQAAYLAEMKQGMSEEELRQLIDDTLAFDAWNDVSLVNRDFVIPVQDLPTPQEPASFTKETAESASYYSAAAQTDGISLHELMLDSSAVAKEDLFYLALYPHLLNDLATVSHSREELTQLRSTLHYGISAGFSYRGEAGSEVPRMELSWFCRPEDYEASLELLLEELSELTLDDAEGILRVIDRVLPAWDMAKWDFGELSEILADAMDDENARYNVYMSGYELYDFYSKLREQLEDDPAAMSELIEKLKLVASQVLRKDRMIVVNIANEDALADIAAYSKQRLCALPSLPETKADYDMPSYAKRMAVIGEGIGYSTYSFVGADDFKELSGKLFPYIVAVSDRYMTPAIRYSGNAYGGYAIIADLLDGFYCKTVKDSTVRESIEIIDGIVEALENMELTQQDLDGYILSAYSDDSFTDGPLLRALRAVEWDIDGFDVERFYELFEEMKQTSLADKPAIVEMLTKAWQNQKRVTVGNAEKIKENAQLFDAVLEI